ncbi:Uma2 family endonuclease [Spirulina sp. 06S082]|uniref:Uma2 family endonuclease n=1 Tax=Spirulina sp. 06S082 TaxID=3110248 RepID=UPI002B21C5AE|nr:Uma2 family endonuclease [Spirulina sp. 06S082]MEA5469465.1 Uma2 family endonuclease [Spirulina sp. 06S082]
MENGKKLPRAIAYLPVHTQQLTKVKLSFTLYNEGNHTHLFPSEAMVQQLDRLSLDEDLLYPDSDGKPLADNTIQFRLIVTIKGGLDALFKNRDDVFVAGDLFWYPVQLTRQQISEQEKPLRQAPDVMVAFGRPKGDRGSYKQWEENNIPPQVAFEILSPGNKKKDMEVKFQFYQKHGIEEYYLYDPKKNRLQGWLRKGEKLEKISKMEGWNSPRLGIKFSSAEGELVLFYPNGERFANYIEIIEQRDRERQRADMEQQRADMEQQRANIEQQRADMEQQRADRNERDRQETQAELEEERQKMQALRDRLQQMGIDPDNLP